MGLVTTITNPEQKGLEVITERGPSISCPDVNRQRVPARPQLQDTHKFSATEIIQFKFGEERECRLETTGLGAETENSTSKWCC